MAPEGTLTMRRYTVAIDGQTFTIDVAETTSDSFEVAVDGQTFEATLTGDHDLPGVAISPEVAASDGRGLRPEPVPASQAATPLQPPSPATASATIAPAPSSPPPARAGRPGPAIVVAPMPGIILEVHVAPGAAVRRGDALVVLEAMKMRNTIRAPRDAVVLEVAVDAGVHVGPGDPLVRLGAPPG